MKAHLSLLSRKHIFDGVCVISNWVTLTFKIPVELHIIISLIIAITIIMTVVLYTSFIDLNYKIK